MNAKNFAQRIKRMIALFPNYKHDLYDTNMENSYAIMEELSNMGINTTIENQTVYYIPENPTGTIGYYTYCFNQYINSFFTFYSLNTTPFCVNITPKIDMWKEFDIENPIVPKLQSEIFSALFGDNWYKYTTISIYLDKYIPLSVKEKLV